MNLTNKNRFIKLSRETKRVGSRVPESRWERFDPIQTFKILNGIDAVDSEIWFRQVGNEVLQITRNTSYDRNLVPTRSRTDQTE